MRNGFLHYGSALLSAAGFAMTAHAAPTVYVSGSLTFPPAAPNYFNAANKGPGYSVPAGYGNSAASVGSVIVAIGSGIEFGYDDLANMDTADFTSNTSKSAISSRSMRLATT